MDDRNALSRRAALRVGGALVGVGGLAGCSSLPFVGATPDPQYTDWLYAPDEAGVGDYGFTLLRPAALAERAEDIGPLAYERVRRVGESFLDLVDVDFEAVDSLLFVGADRSSVVLQGEYDREDVRAELGYDDFRRVGETESVGVYLPPEGDRVVGVADSYLAFAEGGPDPRAAVERLVETQAGEVPRYVDASSTVRTLTRSLGDGTVLFGARASGLPGRDTEAGRFEGQVASGLRFTVPEEEEEERVAFLRLYVFDGERAVPTDAVRAFVEDNRGTGESFDDVEDVAVAADGRTVRVTGGLNVRDFVATLFP
ncbi:hypothetical protein [Halomarina litorea]|uniref:hypothetical protein n=1 Tax=Halomarina litorea TaxID=2961595 RepID=UPI0020C4B758|nr:hypothetical protein [Halomarina sp. BCD28]